MILDLGLDPDGRILLRFYDDRADCETEVSMSPGEARQLVLHLQEIIAIAARLSREEGCA
jgi:hypothetical protein